ncbi:hypothetical protein BASA61_006577 [Batrachochytrium salamandrivorans]|nr:hypothetical protein BASA62_007147 [Batrachochytrium salamandrivorans]KAH6586347.1 hypothetical protein BASA61_006577 [Batrachochytrium salamandrivorans]KAJ1341689.1 hypothetical protein BSLG_003711 [Batrachochytrium salamandrivorans]
MQFSYLIASVAFISATVNAAAVSLPDMHDQKSGIIQKRTDIQLVDAPSSVAILEKRNGLKLSLAETEMKIRLAISDRYNRRQNRADYRLAKAEIRHNKALRGSKYAELADQGQIRGFPTGQGGNFYGGFGGYGGGFGGRGSYGGFPGRGSYGGFGGYGGGFGGRGSYGGFPGRGSYGGFPGRGDYGGFPGRDGYGGFSGRGDYGGFSGRDRGDYDGASGHGRDGYDGASGHGRGGYEGASGHGDQAYSHHEADKVGNPIMSK